MKIPNLISWRWDHTGSSEYGLRFHCLPLRLLTWPSPSKWNQQRETESLYSWQYVFVSSPLRGRLATYCFLFKSLGLEFVVLSLWGTLSDERPGLSFVSHSPVICLCVHLLFTFLSFTHLPYIYIYTLYNTYNIYKASFGPSSVQQIIPYYSLVAQATTAV
jgi:hypothetical protein